MSGSGRKTLPHEVPHWVSDNPSFFITICAHDRQNQPLLQGDTPAALLRALRHQHTGELWWIHAAVIMPDHLHFLATFTVPMPESVSHWKQWTSKNCRIAWQRDFFDHRLRHDESLREKADYILMNPLRAGLVSDWRHWPHHWIGE